MELCLKTAAEALRKSSSESIDCSKPVIVPTLRPSEAWAQGDVAILCIARLPSGAKKCKPPVGGQVAPGNTQGSRHCVVAREGAKLTYYRFSGDTLSDLCLRVEGGPWNLTHPEHAHHSYGPGLYQFVHEQNENMQRVRD